MVLIKNLTTTQIGNLANNGGEVIFNSTLNRPYVNIASGFNKFVLSNLSDEVTGLAAVSATNLTGTLQTAAQPNVTSLGTLTSLTCSGSTSYTDTTASTSPTEGAFKLSGGLSIAKTTDAASADNGGTFTTAGGAAIKKKLYVGTDLHVGGNLLIAGTTTSVETTVTTMEDNTLVLNSGPAATGTDSGILTKRYQIDNNAGTGSVMEDTEQSTITLLADGDTSTFAIPDGNATDDYYKGWWVKVTSGDAADNVRQITGYVGSTKVATVSSVFTAAPVTGVSIKLYTNSFSSLLWKEDSKRFVAMFSSIDKNPALSIMNYADIEAKNVLINSTVASTSNSTGALTLAGGIGISNSTEAQSATNGGTFTTAGGAAIAKKLYVGGNVTMSGVDAVLSLSDDGSAMTISGLTDATDSATGGTLTVSGGAAIAKKLFVGGNMTMSGVDAVLSLSDDGSSMSISGLTDATDSATGGTLTVSGGAAIAKKLFVGGNMTMSGVDAVLSLSDDGSSMTISGLTDATDNATGGTLTVSGGAAVAKKLFVGTDLTVNKTVTVNGAVTGTLSAAGVQYKSVAATYTDNATAESGTNAAAVVTSYAQPTLAATNATVTTTNAATMYIANAPAAGANMTLTNAYALWVAAGKVKLGDNSSTTSSTVGSVLLAGGLAISHDTEATDATNGGSITTAGGVAIAKKLFVGGNVTMSGVDAVLSLSDDGSSMSISGLTDATDSATGGTLTVAGGAAVAKKLFVGSNLTMSGVDAVLSLSDDGSSMTISGLTDATDNATGGTLTVAGGAAVAKKLFVGTDLTVNKTVTVNGAVTGTLSAAGVQYKSVAATYTDNATAESGTNATAVVTSYAQPTIAATNATVTTTNAATMYIANAPAAGANMTLTNAYALWIASGLVKLGDSTASTSSTAGAVLLAGGLSIAKDTEATDVTNGGTFTTAGGAAIAKKLFVGGDASVAGSFTLNGSVLTNTQVDYLTNITPGTAQASKALILNSSGNITSGINELTVTTLNATTLNYDSAGASSFELSGPVTGTLSDAGIQFKSVASTFTDNATLKEGTNTTAAVTSFAQPTLAATNETVTTTNAATIYIADAPVAGTNMTLTNAYALWVASGKVKFGDTTASTSTTAGAVMLAGGLSIAKDTDASSVDNGGSFTIAGGAAIKKKLYVGGDFSAAANATFTGPIMKIPVGDTASRPETPANGQIRYNSETSQFEGYGPGSAWGSLGGVMDVDQDTKILAEVSAGNDDDTLRFLNAGNETMRLTSTSTMGLGTSAPDKKLEINSADGNCLRLTYNDANGSATNYVDLLVTDGGDLTLTPSGGDINITSHDGSTTGLKLNGTLVTATATELNYTDVTTIGTAQASKALVLDTNKYITSIAKVGSASLELTGELTGTLSATGVQYRSLASTFTDGTTAESGTNATAIVTSFAQPTLAATNATVTTTNAATVYIANAPAAGTNMTLTNAYALWVAAGKTKFSDTTDSSSSTSGAVQLLGGMGIDKSLFVKTSVNTKVVNTTFEDASGSTVTHPIVVTRNTTDTPAVGLGAGIGFYIENSVNANQFYGGLEISATNVTDGAEEGKFQVNLVTAGAESNALTLTKTSLSVEELIETSDRRVKENFVASDLEESFNRVMQLKMTDYNFIHDTDKRVHRGVIAQELEEIIPNAVVTIEKDGYDDFKTVSSKELVGYMLCTLQFMNKKYDNLEKKYNELEEKYNSLL